MAGAEQGQSREAGLANGLGLAHCARPTTATLLTGRCVPVSKSHWQSLTTELWHLSSALFLSHQEMLLILHLGQPCGWFPHDFWGYLFT